MRPTALRNDKHNYCRDNSHCFFPTVICIGPDVENVIHLGPPEDLESYIQETGGEVDEMDEKHMQHYL